MAEEETKPEEETAEEEKPAKKKLAGKTMILFIVLPAFLILAGGVAVGMMLAGGGKEDTSKEYAEAKGDYEKSEDGSDKKGDDYDKKDGDKEKKDEKKDKGGKDKKAGYGDDKGGKKGPVRDTGTLQVGNAGDPSYYIMPDLLVNLASQDGDRQLFLKLKLTLEAEDPEMFSDIPKMLPRITDQYQMFLRELRVDDLNGSAGGYRLRLELLRRINIAIAPSRVDAVLIEEMLVQ
ncbi:flagellar basal body-associated FliL family protein [Hirschia maritima]|uniref:flagellar basal body-associated FliL family protein n=1 Tax=Hirschia maritima TaxID=1121961 RepID=UPI0003661AA4|nr:flagellar basal body-associated FliL family protein [Hirschia maritima]